MPFIVDPPNCAPADVAVVPEPAYTVALCDFHGLPAKERMAAEIRYCQALERRLGSAAVVAHTLRAVMEAEEDALSPEAQALTMRWRMANTAARQVGLQGLGEPAEAYFHVRPA